MLQRIQETKYVRKFQNIFKVKNNVNILRASTVKVLNFHLNLGFFFKIK